MADAPVVQEGVPGKRGGTIGGSGWRAGLRFATAGDVFSHLCAPGGGIIFAGDVGRKIRRQGGSMDVAQRMAQFRPMLLLQRHRKAVTAGNKWIEDGGRCTSLGKEAPVSYRGSGQ